MIVDRPDLPGGKLELKIEKPERDMLGRLNKDIRPGEQSAYLCRMLSVAAGVVVGSAWRVIYDDAGKPHKLPKMKEGKIVHGESNENPPEMTQYEKTHMLAWVRVPDMHSHLSMGELVRRYGDSVLAKIPKVDRDRIDGIKAKEIVPLAPSPVWPRSR